MSKMVSRLGYFTSGATAVVSSIAVGRHDFALASLFVEMAILTWVMAVAIEKVKP